MSSSVKDLAVWLAGHDNYVLICHIRPDGDTLGSSLALCAGLRSMGKRAFCVCQDAVPRLYGFLPGADEIVTGGEMPSVPDCWISVDVADTARMGAYEAGFLNAKDSMAIDHHGSNAGFGSIFYVEENAAATGEIILKLLKELGVGITREIADCLYTAISTDCGNFSFSCTHPETMEAAGECIKYGAEPEKLSRILFRMRTENVTRLLGAALSRIEMSPGKKVAMILMPSGEYEKYGCLKSDSHAFVNYLNEIEGVNIGIMIDETEDGVKASFRAANGADVAKFAAMFGGGGHTAAAGATLPGKALNEAGAEIMKAAIEYVGE